MIKNSQGKNPICSTRDEIFTALPAIFTTSRHWALRPSVFFNRPVVLWKL